MQYDNVEHIVFSDPTLPHPFWVFDKPSEGRLLINQAPGAAIAMGAAKGLTFGIADPSTPQQIYERAAEMYLRSTGRICSVSGVVHVLARTNYEAYYSCDVVPGEASAKSFTS